MNWSLASGFLMLLFATMPQQITIIDTGSTNRRGSTIVCHADGSADVKPRNTAEAYQIALPAGLWDQLAQDVESGAPLANLPARHCMKSVSFGSRMFLEIDADRSPDLSCPNQQDPRVQALQKDAVAVLKLVR